MKQLENTLQDLKCMLIEDGYKGDNIVMRTLIKAQQQVKNLNIPAVIKSVCDDCTAYPFDERGKTPLCSTCKDNPKQTVL